MTRPIHYSSGLLRSIKQQAHAMILLLAVGCAAGGAPRNAPPVAVPAASDWSTSYRGSGSLTVHVQNGSAQPIFVKVRHRENGNTAAQVAVASSSHETIQVEGGAYVILLKTQIEGHARFFKGRDLDIPTNARGEATLLVGVGMAGQGEGLQEVSAAEFGQ